MFYSFSSVGNLLPRNSLIGPLSKKQPQLTSKNKFWAFLRKFLNYQSKGVQFICLVICSLQS